MDGVKLERKAFDYLPVGTRFRPLRDQIIVKVLPLKLSDTIHAEWGGGAVRGEVIAAGKGHYPNIHKRGQRDGKDFREIRSGTYFRPTEVRVGQIVHLGGMENGSYIWPKVMIGPDEHIICTERDVCGIET